MAEESLEPLITQCPTCRTRFRVSEAQLEVAAGRVRCGACLSVFTGPEHLVLGSGPRLRPGETANAALDALLEELRTEPSTEPMPVESSESAQSDEPEHPAENRASTDLLADSVAASDTVDDPEDGAATEAQDSEPPATPAVEAPVARGARTRTSRDAPEETPNAPFNTSLVYPGEPTRAVPLAALDLDPEDLIERPTRRRRRWWVPFALLSGAALLIAQVLYFQFDAWAKDPQIRPVYEWLCPRVHCELPVMRALEAIYPKNLVVRALPDAPGTLLVDALIVNQATFPQPFPVLEIRFSSLAGSLVAARRFRPEEYLAGELAGGALMPSLTPVHVALRISDPGNEAVNYKLQFR